MRIGALDDIGQELRAEPRPGHGIDITVDDPRQLRHELLVPAGIEGADRFLDQRIGRIQRQMHGGGIDDRAGAVMGRDGEMVGLREACDLARLGDAADPAEVGHHDADGARG